MNLLFPPAIKATKVDVCYYIVLALRSLSSFVAMVPANRKQVEGWLGAQDYRKRVKQRAIDKLFGEELKSFNQDDLRLWEELQVQIKYGAGGEAAAAREKIKRFQERLGFDSIKEEVERQYRAEIAIKAEHIMDEVTSDGWDSPLPSDYRFKMTRNGYPYCGGGNIKRMLKQSAYDQTGSVGIMQWLSSRFWVSPGKIVYHRPEFVGGDLRYRPMTISDIERYESNIPPEPRSPQNFFRGKSATIFYAEKISYPCHLRFCLWTSSEIEERVLRVWFEVGGEQGLGGARQMQEGQFDLLLLRRLTEKETAHLLELEEQKNVGSFRPDNPDYEKEPQGSSESFIESMAGYDSEYIEQLVL